MKQTAENKAAEAPAPFYVDYNALYGQGYALMRRALDGVNQINPAAGKYLEYRDHRTVVIHGNRQTGKTRFVQATAIATDVVVCLNTDLAAHFRSAGPTTFRQLFEGDEGKILPSNVITVKSLIEDDTLELMRSTDIRRVFVDDAICIFDRYTPAKVYKALLRLLSNLNHIVLVG